MHINKQELLIYYDNKEIYVKKYCFWLKSTLKNIVSGCVVRSEHRIDILNVKSVRKKHLNVFITEPPIEKMVSFWDSVKKPPEVVYKKISP